MAILEVINVTKNYGKLKALKDVSITIGEGEIFGLIGPNGAGKSTLVDVISGFTRYTTGDILFFKKSIRGLKPHQIGKLGISRTFQNVQSFSNMTVLDTVIGGALFGKAGKFKWKRSPRKQVNDILDFLGLTGIADVPVIKLTLQERKRLEMARALATDPELLILDEVTDGLNTAEIKNWLTLVKKIRDSGVTIMVIEHIMKAISSLCDRIAVLNQGKNLLLGTPDEVMSNVQVIELYLGKRKH